MALVKTAAGVVTIYPYSYDMLKATNLNASWPKYPTPAFLASYEVFAVAGAVIPPFNPALQKPVEGTPVLIVSTWTQVWNIVALSPSEQEDYKTQFVANAKREMMSYVDSFAQTRDYASADRCVSYAGSAKPQLNGDATYMATARDDVVAAGYVTLAQIQSGAIPVPSMDDFIDGLPVLSWPNPETWPAVNGTGVL